MNYFTGHLKRKARLRFSIMASGYERDDRIKANLSFYRFVRILVLERNHEVYTLQY